MTGTTKSAGQLKFKAPACDEWCALSVDGQDKDQEVKTKAVRDSLKETLLTSLQMHLHVMYRLTWYDCPSDTREAIDGRDPVDFRISRRTLA